MGDCTEMNELIVKPAKYIFIDVETTGFAAMRHCVITLAAYVTDEDHNILGEFYGEFRPNGSKEICWTEDAERVHGITWDTAIKFPPISESLNRFRSFLKPFGPLTLLAHNMPFDRRMIRDLFSKDMAISSEFDNLFPEQFCTLKLLKDSGLVSTKSKSLGGVCTELGIEHNHHDARSDAFVLIEIHKRCYNKQNNGNHISTCGPLI